MYGTLLGVVIHSLNKKLFRILKMGLCGSKVAPERQYELLRIFMETIRSQTAFYNKVFIDGRFDTQSFQYHVTMEKKIQHVREEFMKILSQRKEKHREALKEYNALRFEYMNNLLLFKRLIHEQLLKDNLIVENALLDSASFRTFFTILPHPDESKSFYTHVLNDKKERDSITRHKHVTEGYGTYKTESNNVCHHCGFSSRIHTSIKRIDTLEKHQPITVFPSVSTGLSRIHSESEETHPVHASQRSNLRISIPKPETDL
jgi:hypothetical protein